MATNEESITPGESAREDLRTRLWSEVIECDPAVGEDPFDHPQLDALKVWGSDTESAAAFGRARYLLQRVAVGHNYWVSEQGLDNLIDPETFSGQSKTLERGAGRLLQLIIFSRTPDDFEERWLSGELVYPIFRDIMTDMRQELGIEDEFQRRRREENTLAVIKFPGITEEDIIQAVFDGRLRTGNAAPGTGKSQANPVASTDEILGDLSVKGAGSRDPMAQIIHGIIDDTFGRKRHDQ